MSNTFYLLNQAPNGMREVCHFTATEMEELFTEAERELLAKGGRLVKTWSATSGAHLVVDMTVAAIAKIEA